METQRQVCELQAQAADLLQMQFMPRPQPDLLNQRAWGASLRFHRLQAILEPGKIWGPLLQVPGAESVIAK